jgi:putative MATE family efflux protein
MYFNKQRGELMTAENAADRMGTEKVGKLLLDFSIPAIVGMLVNAIYNVVDRIYIGRGVDAAGIAGIGVVMPIMMVIMALSALVGIGSNSLFAIKMGEGKEDEVEKIMGHAFALLFLFPAIGIILSNIFFDSILRNVLKVSDTMYPYAATYLRIILYGAIFGAMSPGITHFIRSDGHPKTSMLVQIIGAVSNIILDPIFIFVFKMGIAGAAWATIISQFISLVFVLAYFNSKWTKLRFRFTHMIHLDKKTVLNILAIGFAPFAMQLAHSLVGIIQNNQIIRYGGDLALTAMTVVFSILTMVFMPLQGIGAGAQPIIGYNYGAKKLDRVRRCYTLSLIACIALLTCGTILTESAPGLCFALFSKDRGILRELGMRTLRICTCGLPFLALQLTGGMFFQAIGKPVQGTILSLSRQFLIFIPCIIFLPILFGGIGLNPVEAIFWTLPISDTLAGALGFVFVMLQFSKWKKAGV